MNVFDFITQDEIDELPDDDDPAAFLQFVRLAQRRLAEFTHDLDEEHQWHTINEARYGFMNVIVGAAKRYSIEPFASLRIPRVSDADAETHRQFKADLDHYVTQLVLGGSGKKSSVLLPQDIKAKIRSYLHHIREAIDKAELDDGKRSELLEKLAAFETELEKKRLNLAAVAWFAMTVLTVPGGVWASAELGNKLVGSILRTVGEAKQAEDEAKRVAREPDRPAITGPRDERKPAPRSGKRVSNGPKENFSADLDDEIPF
ncbi:MAG: hypothetical protein WDN76_13080 [Alphaproteobacteria bacterium]